MNISFRGWSCNFFHSGSHLFSTAGKTTDQQCSFAACYHGEDTQSWDLSTEAKPNSTRRHSLTPRVLTHGHRYASCIHRHTQKRGDQASRDSLGISNRSRITSLKSGNESLCLFLTHTQTHTQARARRQVCFASRTPLLHQAVRKQLSFLWGRDELYSLDVQLMFKKAKDCWQASL